MGGGQDAYECAIDNFQMRLEITDASCTRSVKMMAECENIVVLIISEHQQLDETLEHAS